MRLKNWETGRREKIGVTGKSKRMRTEDRGNATKRVNLKDTWKEIEDYIDYGE